MIEELAVGGLYSNEDIYKSLRVSNAGGIRVWCPSKEVARAVIMTSLQGLHGTGENPYHDRLEAGILTYTAAGKLGEQTLSGMNSRLIEQKASHFPIRCRGCPVVFFAAQARASSFWRICRVPIR